MNAVDTPDTSWRWIRKPELVARSGMSYATLWRLARQGSFPQFHEVGPRTVAVRSDQFDAWMQSRPVSSISSPRKPRPTQANAAPEAAAQ